MGTDDKFGKRETVCRWVGVVTMMGMHSVPLHCTLKMAKTVTFRLRIIYNFSETRGRSEALLE